LVIMPPALETLSRLRRLATDQARRDLASMLAIEHAAETRLAAAKAAMVREAASWVADAKHPLAGAYAAWLPAAHARRAVAATAVQAAEAEIVLARGLLADARAAAKSVEFVADARAEAVKRDAMRRDQARADDLAGRGKA
jgi:flagellar export protein FliJ